MKKTVVLLCSGACLFLGATLLSARKPATLEEVTTGAYLAAVAVGDAPQPCRNSIGRGPALALVRYCRYVTSATHPPCNSANECALIVDHIRGMCRGSKANPLPCGEGMTDAEWKRISRFDAL